MARREACGAESARQGQRTTLSTLHSTAVGLRLFWIEVMSLFYATTTEWNFKSEEKVCLLQIKITLWVETVTKIMIQAF